MVKPTPAKHEYQIWRIIVAFQKLKHRIQICTPHKMKSWKQGPPIPLTPLCNCTLSPVIVNCNDSLPGLPVGLAGMGPAGASPCLEAPGGYSTYRQHSRHEFLQTVHITKYNPPWTLWVKSGPKSFGFLAGIDVTNQADPSCYRTILSPRLANSHLCHIYLCQFKQSTSRKQVGTKACGSIQSSALNHDQWWLAPYKSIWPDHIQYIAMMEQLS